MAGASESDLALQVESVSKHFGGVHALTDVSLVARVGEVTAIVGDNGAGKSTLIKCIVGIHRPDEGSIALGGSTVSLSSPDEARALGVETVYQDLSLVDSLTVAQNFFLGRELTAGVRLFRWLNRRAMASLVDDALSRLSVNVPSARSRVRYLSGGQRQAIAIARAAHFGKKLVIMDEPTASLGVQETARVEQIIRDLRAEGVPILLVSHDMQQVMRLSDQVWALRSGRLAGGGRTTEMNPERLVALITGAAEQPAT